MKSRAIGISSIGIIVALCLVDSRAQMLSEGRTQNRCLLCGRGWTGEYHYFPAIPDSLHSPRNKQWIRRLDALLKKERFAMSQYRHEPEIYRLHEPYTLIIPHKQSQVEWLTALFPVVGLRMPDSTTAPPDTTSWHDVLTVSMAIEKGLIRDYEWLVQYAEDEKIRRVLSDFLYQTRMHFIMFQHTLSMRELLRSK
jgi:hypothetical protein